MKLYPVEISLKVHITDGETIGSADYAVGLHRLPTEEMMHNILAEVCGVLPDGFRLMSRQESTMYFLRQRKGYRGPALSFGKMDEGEEWHDPASENTFSTLFDDDGEDDTEER